MKTFLVTVILALALTGCSVLSTVAEDRNQLAVQYATLKVMESDSVDGDRLVELVTQAREYVDTGESVAVSTLAAAARERLAESGLSPADKILIDAILTRAQARLEAEIGEGLLTGEQRVQLLTVLGWIEAAAGGSVSP